MALPTPAGGQDVSEDPLWVAVQWLMEAENLTDLGPRLVVDTVNAIQGLGLLPRPLDAERVGASRAIADRAGSRTGRLTALMTCPQGPPDPEVLARGQHRGCHFEDSVSAVLQTDAPEPWEEGIMVRVASWIFRENQWGGHGIDFHSAEVFLKEKAEGGWEFVRLGFIVRGHW